MLKDSTTASTGVSDELEEVEEELGSGTGTAVPLSPSAKPAADPDDAESAPLSGGEKLPPAALDNNASEEDDSVHGGGGGAAAAGILAPLAPLLAVLPPILIQAFTLTFVAEWGDRSQIATIAMAADQDVFGVTIGGILGHALCTGIAVVGGKLLATRISERTVLQSGGALFLIFAVAELVHGPGE